MLVVNWHRTIKVKGGCKGCWVSTDEELNSCGGGRDGRAGVHAPGLVRDQQGGLSRGQRDTVREPRAGRERSADATLHLPMLVSGPMLEARTATTDEEQPDFTAPELDDHHASFGAGMIPQAAGPSASDQAYGSPLYDKQPGAVTGAETKKPNGNAEFDRLTDGKITTGNAPSEIVLPAAAQKGLQQEWDASKGGTPGAQEHGGNLVREHDGKAGYAWRSGKPGNNSTFNPDEDDVGKGQKLAGVGHTHPYENGKENVSFSAEDISSVVDETDPVNLLQSGSTQFVISRTAEFEARIKGKDDDELAKLKKAIEKTWYAAFGSDGAGLADGKYQERVEQAVRTTCAHFDLAYYRGHGGTLEHVK